MPQIFIHIGTHKTGTTSIQRSLALAYDDLLENGILYPVAGRPSQLSGHHLLAWSILGTKGVNNEVCWDDVLAEIHSGDPQTVVLSAEGFAVCSPEQVERIRRITDSYHVKIIIYLRNQLKYMVSDYKGTIKSGSYSHPFHRFLKSREARYNYFHLIKKWAEVFGSENIEIRIYDKVISTTGLLDDFLSIIGVSPVILQKHRELRENISPSDDVVILIRSLNKIIKNIEIDFIKKFLYGFRKLLLRKGSKSKMWVNFGRKIYQQNLYEKEDIDWLRDAVKDKNHLFLESYIHSEDRHYFDF